MRPLSHEIGVGQNGQDTPKNVFVKRMLNVVTVLSCAQMAVISHGVDGKLIILIADC